MSRFDPQGHARPFHARRVTCVVCGESRFEHDTTTGAEMTSEVMALLGLTRDESIACKAHVDAANRELDDAADALELDNDPAFAAICDDRAASYLAHAMAHQAEPSPMSVAA